MSFKVVFSSIFCALVVGSHGAAIPHDAAADGDDVVYLASVRYGKLPEDGVFYEYIQPVAALEHEAPWSPPAEERRERRRRQTAATISTDTNGNTNYVLQSSKPIAGNDRHMLSAAVNVAASSANPGLTTGAGLNYDHVSGHGASLGSRHVAGLGDQVTAAGKFNLINADKHRVDANAFHTRTFIENNGPTLKTNGGSLDYLFNNKHGASLGVSHTDLIKSTTYSGTGKFNLFQSPARDTSFDLTGGLSKTTSPFMPSTGWQPVAGFSFTKMW